MEIDNVIKIMNWLYYLYCILTRKHKNVKITYSDITKYEAFNKYRWVFNATIKDADITISPKGLVWRNGVWIDGKWVDGIWKDGVFVDGLWCNGLWCNGIWYNGTWKTGAWHNGIWYHGAFIRGTWSGGVWVAGASHAMTILDD